MGSGRAVSWLSAIVVTALALVGSWATVARAAALPDGRAFELVSEPDTNGNPAFQAIGDPSMAMLSDNAVLYGGGIQGNGASQGAGAGDGAGNPTLLATRTPTGWTTSTVSPPTNSGLLTWQLEDATPSLSGAVFGGGPAVDAPLPPSATPPYILEYRNASGAFSPIATVPYTTTVTYGGMSANGQTVVFSSVDTPTGTPLASGLQTVYAWHPDGSASVIEGQPGDPLAGCNATIAKGPNAVSADGSTIFLQASSGSGSCSNNQGLYASIDGHSHEISVSTDGTQSTPQMATFEGATPDGRTAYFETSQPLTQGAPTSPELYQWSAATGQVTCVSCSVTSGAGLANNSVPVSSLGNYVYFDGYDPTPGANGALVPDLFVFHDDVVSIVDSNYQSGNILPFSLQMSPDGSVVVYSVNPSGGQAGALYRAVVGSTGVSTPQCITCDIAGTAGAATMGFTEVQGGTFFKGASTISGGGEDAISGDGNTVVFETTNALGAADDSYQVYEWTPSGGDQFIANGADNASQAGVTPDAQDVFFVSDDALTPTVQQPGVSAIFDARVDGGFPVPSAPAACSGDGCQGASPGGVSPPITSGSGCCGNVSGSTASLALRRPSAASLRRAARDGRLSMTVRARGDGRLRLMASDTIKGKPTVVASAVLSVRETRTRAFSVTLRLSPASRRALRERRLVVTVSASLPGARETTQRLTIPEDPRQTGGRS